MTVNGYRGVKDYRYTDLDCGEVDFGIRDQKGRKIGYQWRIYDVVVELMTDEEYAAAKSCYLIANDKPSHYIEMRSSTTRDGYAYGPSTKRMQTDTLEQARRSAVGRVENARKANTKKFAAFNEGAA